MARRFATRAEELRHHRKCLELAIELRCTPKEAEERMEQLQKHEEARAWSKKRGLAWQAPEVPGFDGNQEAFERFEARWMMRD